MNELDQKIGMPYRESEGYVNDLVNRATEQAIRHQRTNKRSLSRFVAVAAIAFVLLAGAGITYYNYVPPPIQLVAENQMSPIDEFFNSLTEEEVQMLNDYEIPDIPEY
jgi:hypothetical protein